MAPRRSYNPKHRPCLVCAHDERVQIEAARIAGISGDVLAEKYGISRDSIYRHMRSHVDEETRAQYIEDVPIRDLVKRAAEEGCTVLDYLRLYRSEMTKQFLQASSLNDRNSVANLGRVCLETNREIARLSGEFLNSPAVASITVNNFTTTQICADMHASALREYANDPEGLRKFIALLEKLEAKQAVPMIDVTPEAEMAHVT
jgi:hypothetical protein